jgi:Mg-chelatase subunit ChlD
MGRIYFHHPQVLWLLAAVVPVILLLRVRSRSGMGPWGHGLSVVLRSVALAAGAVALAGPAVRSEEKVTATPPILVLADESESVTGSGSSGALRQTVVRALDRPEKPPEQFFFAGGVWRGGEAAIEPDQTNIEHALDVACEPRIGAGPTADAAEGGDVVLLTDGRSTRGSAAEAAARWAARGVRVHVVPVGWQRTLPPHLAEVEPPLQSQVGMAATVRVTSSSDSAEPYDVALVDPGGKVVDRRTIATPGRSTAILRFTPDKAGSIPYTVRVSAADQSMPVASNLAEPTERKLSIPVSGPPRVLIADNFPDEIRALEKALAELKLPVDVIRPDQWPSDLTPYAAVVISDFSGKELSDDQRLALRRYVEQVGGGLVFIGGNNVVPSRWAENRLSELLPVKLRDRPKEVVQKPRDVAVCFVFDRSGSMNQVLPGSSGNVSKLELVKASIIASLRGLPDNATVCAIAFDTEPRLVVPPTDLSQREAVAKAIDSVDVGGGTDVYPAARMGVEGVAQLPGDKYFIVLTDGRTRNPPTPDAWQRLAQAARQAGISWTSIAVGVDADQALLQMLATMANGRFAYCGTGDAIPKVFIEQTQAIRKVAEQKSESFEPRPGAEAQDLGDDVAKTALPKLEGAVPADLKPSARTQLLAKDRDVLLASWQFGAGRVIAFTSDAKNAWSKPWMGETAYPKVWTKIVSSVARSRPKLSATVRSWHSGSRYRYTFDVREGDGAPAENLEATAIVDPASTTQPATAPTTARVTTTWRRRGAGVYQVDLDLPPDGRSHEAQILIRRDDRQAIQYQPTMFSPRTIELAETGIDLQACREIAFAGNGLCSADPTVIAQAVKTRPEQPPVQREKRLAPWFLLAMLCLWPIDVWTRKLL